MGDRLYVAPNTVQGVGDFLIDVGDHAANAGLSFYEAMAAVLLEGPADISAGVPKGSPVRSVR